MTIVKTISRRLQDDGLDLGRQDHPGFGEKIVMRIIMGSALALALSGISILCCFVFGTHLAPGNEGQLYGVLGGTADALKAITAGQMPRAIAGIILFLAFSAYSFTSELGLYALGRDAVSSEAAAGKESLADLKQERAKIAARLKELGPQRPAGTVRGAIAAAKAQRSWQTSNECTAPSSNLERDLCGKIEKLQGELAAAEEAERLRTKDDGISIKLEGMDVAAALKSTDAQADSLSRLTGFSAASIKDGLAIMVAVLIELGSGLGLWVTTAGAGHGQAKQAPADGKGPERGNGRPGASCDSCADSRLRRGIAPAPDRGPGP
jgi:hypothetical protein